MPHARLALLAALIASPAFAQAAPETLTLSDAEKAQILDAHAPDPAGMSLEALAARPAPQVHGEVGMFIGTHGTRGAYGAAAIPLGQNAEADISFYDGQSDYYRRR